MHTNKLLLACFLMIALSGCKSSPNAGYLPPLTNAPIESGPEAAINNSAIINSEKAGS